MTRPMIGPIGQRDRGAAPALQTPLLARQPALPDPLAGGMLAAGKMLGEVADIAGRAAMLQRLQDERLGVARTLAEEREAWTKDLQTRQEQALPGAPDFAKGVYEAFDKRSEELLSNDRLSAHGREELQLRLYSFRNEIGEKAQSFEAGARLVKRQDDADVVLRGAAADVARDPSAFGERLSDAQSAIRALGLPPIYADRKLKEAAGSLANSALVSLADRDPRAAHAALNSGAFDLYLDPEKRVQLGHYIASEGKRLAAEAAAKEREARAEARVTVTLQLQDAHAAWGRGETYTGPVPDDAQIMRAFKNPEEAARVISGMRVARDGAAVATTLALLPPDRRRAIIEQYRPEGENYRLEAETYDHLTRQNAMLQKMQADDPAGYVARYSPQLQKLAGDAQKAQDAGQDDVAHGLRSRAAALSLQLQAEAGTPEHERRILPKAMAEGLTARMNAMPGDAKGDAVEGLKKTWGDQWPTIFRELRASGLPDEFEALAWVKDPAARKRLGENLNNLQALHDTAGPAARKVRDAVFENLADIRSSLSFAPDGPSAFQRMEKAVTVQALSYVGAGMEPADAATRAYKDVVEHNWDFVKQPGGVTARAPKGMLGNVQGLADRTLSGLTPDMLADPGGESAATRDLTPDQRRQQLAVSLKNSPLWVNNGNDDGLILLDRAMRPVRRADGKPLEIKFSAAGWSP